MLLIQFNEKTKMFQPHHSTSFGFLVKEFDDVLIRLLERFDIPTTSIIFHKSPKNVEVSKLIVEVEVKNSFRIVKLFKTNTLIKMFDDEVKIQTHFNV